MARVTKQATSEKGKRPGAGHTGRSKTKAATAVKKIQTSEQTPKQAQKQATAELPRKRLPAAPKLFWRSLKLLWNNRKLFSVILLIYAVLYAVLVGGAMGGTALDAVKTALNKSGSSTGVSAFVTTLIGTSGNTKAGGSAYQTILLLLMSVVIIWALRQVYAGGHIRARDAFYQGVYPLIPFILVLVVVGLELLPAGIGIAVYTTTMSNGIAVGFWEALIVLSIAVGLSIVSLYLLCSSLFALYIVTLPDATPIQALKSANELVRHRRLVVGIKIVFLPLVLIVLSMLILVPVVQYLSAVAALILLLLSVLTVAVVHSYMYSLYRELL